ncbi:MAG: DUF3300 domain-containing protein [Gammaproteobacteria bacterium]|nr:DUF3300 domain-containing protein [Gammaproteobacteria bacterium]
MNSLLSSPKAGPKAGPKTKAAPLLGFVLLALLLFGERVGAESVVEEIVFDAAEISVEPIEPLSRVELEALVARIALYPDDLLSIVLPASTYPLQIVQAARFLKALDDKPGLEPSDDWDDSIVALLNYPEALELMDSDLDWTWKLGAAVLTQQAEVIAAVGDFRVRARLAGNLRSDEHQTVVLLDDGTIEIRLADPEVIYVPYYEPSQVTVASPYLPRTEYHYYSRGYPVYYYPYASDHVFSSGFFWGVTSAFSIGWRTHHLRVHHDGYRGHPYNGHRYHNAHYYRRPHVSLARGRDIRKSAYRQHAGNHRAPHARMKPRVERPWRNDHHVALTADPRQSDHQLARTASRSRRAEKRHPRANIRTKRSSRRRTQHVVAEHPRVRQSRGRSQREVRGTSVRQPRGKSSRPQQTRTSLAKVQPRQSQPRRVAAVSSRSQRPDRASKGRASKVRLTTKSTRARSSGSKRGFRKER